MREKKYNNEKKRKKNFWAQDWFGLLPNCIVIEGFVLQEKGLSG